MDMYSNDEDAVASEKNVSSSAGEPLFFISAGDPSGDAHAARLVEALVRIIPNARFIGFAGSKTAKTQCDVRFDLTQYAVMMLKRAILNLPVFLKALNQAKNIFLNEKPDLVILVDFPGFNWQIAKRAKAAGIPVLYFMPPQIWGWGQWRIKKMRKFVDLILSCFKFEDRWFVEHGCNSIFIGHPFFEETRSKSVDVTFLQSLNSSESGVSIVSSKKNTSRGGIRYLTILPGSRNQEVVANIERLIRVAEIVKQNNSDVQPVFAAYKDSHAEIVRRRLHEKGLDYPVYVGKTPELLRAATCCLGVSGSSSLEILSLCKPSVVVYHTSRLEYIALRYLKRVKYITLTNLLAVDRIEGESPFYPRGYVPSSTAHTPHEREMMVCPEFISWKDEPEEAAFHLCEWFSDVAKLDQKIEQLTELKKAVDVVECPLERAAAIIKENFSI